MRRRGLVVSAFDCGVRSRDRILLQAVMFIAMATAIAAFGASCAQFYCSA